MLLHLHQFFLAQQEIEHAGDGRRRHNQLLGQFVRPRRMVSAFLVNCQQPPGQRPVRFRQAVHGGLQQDHVALHGDLPVLFKVPADGRPDGGGPVQPLAALVDRQVQSLFNIAGLGDPPFQFGPAIAVALRMKEGAAFQIQQVSARPEPGQQRRAGFRGQHRVTAGLDCRGAVRPALADGIFDPAARARVAFRIDSREEGFPVGQLGQQRLAAGPHGFRGGQPDPPARHRGHRRRPAQDEPVVGGRRHRLRRHHRSQHLAAPGQGFVLQQEDLARRLGRARVELDLLGVPQGRVEPGNGLDPHVKLGGGRQVARRHHHLPALGRHLAPFRHVQRQALAGPALVGIAHETLHPAHMPRLAAGREDHRVSDPDGAGHGDARDHLAEPLLAEHFFHRHPEHAAGRAARQRADPLHQDVVKDVIALARFGGDRADRRALQEGALQEGFDFADAPRHLGGVDQVGLGQRHHAVAHAHQFHDLQMLDGLRHDAVVGGNDQDGQVDPRHPRHHGAHEPLVAGHVDDAHAEIVAQEAGGEAQLDGEAPLLLLFQAVGLAARQHLDQPRLPVVHVARGADHHQHLGMDVGLQQPRRVGVVSRHVSSCRPCRFSRRSPRTKTRGVLERASTRPTTEVAVWPRPRRSSTKAFARSRGRETSRPPEVCGS